MSCDLKITKQFDLFSRRESDILETKQTSGGTSYYLWFAIAPKDYNNTITSDYGYTDGTFFTRTIHYVDKFF